MRHHDDGFAGFVQLGQHHHDFIAGPAVEVPGRLVGEDELRVVHQGAGDRHPLLLAPGQLQRPVVEPVAQADHLREGDAPGIGLLV